MTKLPEGYSVPSSGQSNYMKWQAGDNKFRVLSDVLLGWEAWTPDKKPVRWPYDKQPMTQDLIDANCIDPKTSVAVSEKHLWAFVVWDYKASAVRILAITQATIQRPMTELLQNEDWGDPREYDITVNKTGEGKDGTSYTVTPTPPKPAIEEIRSAYKDGDVNLEALITNDDPFESKTVGQDTDKSDIKADDIPF